MGRGAKEGGEVKMWRGLPFPSPTPLAGKHALACAGLAPMISSFDGGRNVGSRHSFHQSPAISNT